MTVWEADDEDAVERLLDDGGAPQPLAAVSRSGRHVNPRLLPDPPAAQRIARRRAAEGALSWYCVACSRTRTNGDMHQHDTRCAYCGGTMLLEPNRD